MGRAQFAPAAKTPFTDRENRLSNPRLVFLLAFLGLLLVVPARGQDDVEQLLDEIQALAKGMGVGGSADLGALATAELPAVELAAGMRATGPVSVRVIDRAEAAAHVAGLVAEQLPPEKLRAMDLAWKALGLLEPEADFGAAIAELYSSQAGGFYDPKTKELVLLSDIPAMFQVPVARHELVHALQDQNHDLQRWIGDAGADEDRGAAIQAVLEGHATDVMNRVTLGDLGLDPANPDPATAEALSELLGADAGDLGDLLSSALDVSSLGGFVPSGTPPFLLAQLLFPYSTGTTFVAGYRAAHPEDPGCAALYARPPRTTAEVLDPRLWEAGGLPPLFVKPGTFLPDHRLLWSSSLGRLITAVLLTGQGDPSAGDPKGGRWNVPDRDKTVAPGSGWRGDRVAVYEFGPKTPGTDVPDGHVVAWVSSWASPEEAAAAEATLRERLPALRIRRTGDRLDAVVDGRTGQAARGLKALETWK